MQTKYHEKIKEISQTITQNNNKYQHNNVIKLILYINKLIEENRQEEVYQIMNDKNIPDNIKNMISMFLFLSGYRPIINLNNETYFCFPVAIPVTITIDNKTFEKFNFIIEELEGIEGTKILNIRGINKIIIDKNLYPFNNEMWVNNFSVKQYIDSFIYNINQNKSYQNNLSLKQKNDSIITNNIVITTRIINCLFLTKSLEKVFTIDKLINEEKFKKDKKEQFLNEIKNVIKQNLKKYNDSFSEVLVYHPVEFFDVPSIGLIIDRAHYIDIQLFFAKHKLAYINHEVFMTYNIVDIDILSSVVNIAIVDPYVNKVIHNINFVTNSRIDDEDFVIDTIKYIQSELKIPLSTDYYFDNNQTTNQYH